jgi:hypothetical protein
MHVHVYMTTFLTISFMEYHSQTTLTRAGSRAVYVLIYMYRYMYTPCFFELEFYPFHFMKKQDDVRDGDSKGFGKRLHVPTNPVELQCIIYYGLCKRM